ncbi:MAG: hypothetical protein WCJ67_04910 [Thermoleophilia bacterium]
MTGMFVAWVAFPLVMGALSLGCGLLLQQASGVRLPGALLLPGGFAVIVIATQFAHLTDQTAGMVTPLVLALAIAGYGLGFPRQRQGIDPWLATTAACVYAVFAAPVVLSGRLTFLGYMKLDDTANYMAMLDRAMDHSYNITGLPPSAYRAILEDIYVGGYPLGALSPLGVGSQLVGEDALWLWQPYLAFLAVLVAFSLYALVSRVISSRPLRTVVVVGGTPAALIYGYALWGGIKELSTAMLAILIAVLVPLTMRQERTRARAVLPLAVASSAMLLILTLPGAVWLVPSLTAAVVLAFRTGGIRRVLHLSGAFVLTASVLLIPAFDASSRLVTNVRTFSESDRLAALAQPLSWLQVFGVWLNGDFKVPPASLDVTYSLVVVIAASAATALALAWRRSAWEIPLAFSTAGFACVIYVSQGSPWIGGKALASSSPIVLTIALTGAAMVFELGRRVEGSVLAGVVIVGVLWSNALQYHEVWLAPESRLTELEAIGKRFAGQGLTMLTENEPFGGNHLLRKMDAESPSLRRGHYIDLRVGGAAERGMSPDIDEIRLDHIQRYRTLVIRRSGIASRPPSDYSLSLSGKEYQVWQRPDRPSRILEHLSIGSRLQPAGVAECSEILRLGRLAATNNGVLAAVRRPPTIIIQGDGTVGVPALSEAYGQPLGALYPEGPTSIETGFTAPASGQYSVWVAGTARTRIDVSIDGRKLASTQNVLQWPAIFVPMGTSRLARGQHIFRLGYGGTSRLRPGTGRSAFDRGLGPYAISRGTQDRPVTLVDPANARSLCGQTLDWVEALRG